MLRFARRKASEKQPAVGSGQSAVAWNVRRTQQDMVGDFEVPYFLLSDLLYCLGKTTHWSQPSTAD